MWWQGKEFSANREADREERASRGGMVAFAVVLVPPVIFLLFYVMGW